MLLRIYYALHRKLWYILNSSKFKKIGKKVIIKKPLYLTPAYMMLSDKVFIHYNSRIEGITRYEGVNFSPNIIIGESCTIQQNLHLTCANKIIIGKNTAIAANVTITDIHHPYDDITIPIERQQIKVYNVIIGENCKIYNNAVILPGTILGNHCTIGANSVVSGIIPDFSVVVGIPAKIVKRFDFERKEWRKTHKDGNFIDNL